MTINYEVVAQTQRLIQPIKDALESLQAQVDIANQLSPIKVNIEGQLAWAWLEVDNANQDLRRGDLHNARISIGNAQNSIHIASKRVREALIQMLEGSN